MKKRFVAAITAAAMALSMPMSASAAWKKDAAGNWYNIDSNGVKATGWLKEGNTWYYLEQTA